MANEILRAEISLKTKNRRINVKVWSDGKEEPIFTVHTKRLIDFKKREIIEVNDAFSTETFIVLSDVMSDLLKDPNVKKIINPFSKFDKWKGERIIYKVK